MPRTKKTKTKKRPYKKNYKKKPIKYNKHLTLIKNPSIGGFPFSVFTTLKYTQSGSLNPGVGGTCATQIFKANCVQDPDETGAGHQPRGYDQWMTIYDHFYVKRSKIEVEFHNGDGSYEVMCGIALRDGNTGETDPQEYNEQDTKGRVLGRVSSAKNHIKLTKYFSFSKSNYQKYTSTQNKGSISTSPSELNYFHLFVGSPWGNDSSNCYYSATIYYQVLFTELKDLAQS